jgi:hypothetical protein
MYSGEYDACDVTLSVYPHRASLKNMPGHGNEDICVRVNRYMPGQGIEDICVRVKADGVSCKFLDYLSIILRTFMN